MLDLDKLENMHTIMPYIDSNDLYGKLYDQAIDGNCERSLIIVRKYDAEIRMVFEDMETLIEMAERGVE